MAKKQTQLDARGYRKFGMLDKLSYASGDFACNMSFALKSYLMVFWTQYMGITEATYALLLVLVQVWDAVNDPLLGAVIDADRRKYKHGKFKAYIFVGSIGLIVAGALCFLPFPNAPAMTKNILYVAGYVFWDAFYTVANVPYGSMLPLITDDTAERAQLSSWRSAGAMIASLPLGIMMPMFIYDSSNRVNGQSIWAIALVMGVLGFVAFQFLIRTTVIRVDVDARCGEDAPKFNILVAVKNFCKNRPAIGATMGSCAMYIAMAGASAAVSVMFQAYFKNAQISGLMALVTTLPMFLFMPFIGKIVRRFGMREAATFGAMFSVLACVLMLLLPITPDGKGMLMYVACQLLNGLGMGVFMCVGNSMMGDAIDYNEWKFGVRDEGTIYAIHSFFRKLSQGAFPSVGLLIAAALGYVAALGPDQSMEVASKMRYLVAWMYLAGAIVQLIGIKLTLSRSELSQMRTELNARKQ